jgi:3-oxoacyl-[acyl-carrier-protein] synthase II
MRHLDATRSAADARARVTAPAVSHEAIPVRIAGVGLLTPLGLSASSTWHALLRGDHVKTHSRVPINAPAAQSRVTALALLAARQAIEEARWSQLDNADDRAAVLVGTSKGPVESWLSPPQHMEVMSYIVGGLNPNGIADVAATIGRNFHFTGPRLTLSAACASGLHALIRAALMLRSGEAPRALVVASESSLHPLFEASFKRLGVLAKAETGCRPFDQHRDGFLMSEAAAAVCLEAAGASGHDDHDHETTVFIDRFAMGGDATHLTGSDPEGTTLKRLLRAVIADRVPDLIHAHGTGTATNDATELAAIESCISAGAMPAIYSHKGALGHSLGAAGLVSVVLNCLMHRHNVVLPNVRAHTPLPTRSVLLSNEPLRGKISRSACIAAGFGGPVAAVSLSSHVS